MSYIHEVHPSVESRKMKTALKLDYQADFKLSQKTQPVFYSPVIKVIKDNTDEKIL